MSAMEREGELGDNVSLEYTRDSPMFRQQLRMFEEAYMQVVPFATRIEGALRKYMQAVSVMKQAQLGLAEALSGAGFSRALFTNSLQDLGSLSETIDKMSNVLMNLNDVSDMFVANLAESVFPHIASLTQQDFSMENELNKLLTKSSEEYQTLLGRSLETRTPLAEADAAKIIEVRKQSECARFDLVQRMNMLDATKKLFLTRAVNNLYVAVIGYHQNGTQALAEMQNYAANTQAALVTSEAVLEQEGVLWSRTRARLEAELMGALPPPGAPPGATAPVRPRSNQTMPPYSAMLTTEVLSTNTKAAPFQDTQHARDEGILKQGYLFRSSGLFSARKRKWYRLHGQHIYVVKSSTAEDLDPSVVCDIADATVASKPGPMPFVFMVVVKDGQRLEFQAENEDEMMKWMTAIRRCATALSNAATAAADPASPRSRHPLLQQFIDANHTCGECGSPEVTWVSTNIGVTLCEECAALHRQLGWAISRVKSLSLDQFSEPLLRCLTEELGNEKANEIWEKCVSSGWAKPHPESTNEFKAQWIQAKYQWFAFVEDAHPESEAQLVSGIHRAVSSGNLRDVMWWIAHKSDINCPNPGNKNMAPLHMAVKKGDLHCVVYLLQNGADIYHADVDGSTPFELAASSSLPEIEQLFLQVQRGEF